MAMRHTHLEHLAILMTAWDEDYKGNPNDFAPVTDYTDSKSYGVASAEYLADIEAKLYAEGKLSFQLFSEG